MGPCWGKGLNGAQNNRVHRCNSILVVASKHQQLSTPDRTLLSKR